MDKVHNIAAVVLQRAVVVRALAAGPCSQWMQVWDCPIGKAAGLGLSQPGRCRSGIVPIANRPRLHRPIP